jgi:hypothetical protein
MGIKDIWNGLIGAVDGEYDRRIKAASNVREYHPGGHGHGHGHDEAHEHHDLPEEQPGDAHAAFGTPTDSAEVERPATVAITH